MKLSINELKNKELWEQKGYTLPSFNIEEVRQNTKKNPTWLHLGAGNIFRAFPAAVHQDLLNEGLCDTGIIVCEAFDEEIIEKAYAPYDNLSILATLKSDGHIDKKVIASVTESIEASKGMDRLVEIFESPSLQMVSFTITEKGYSLTNAKGEYFPDVDNELNNFIENPKSIIGRVAMLSYKRYLAGKLPVSFVSMDNCSQNGTKLYDAVSAFVDKWVEKGFVGEDFREYMNNSEYVYFTWSMIDKITPRPSDDVREILANDGIEDTEIVCTSKNTYVSSFVNAEQAQYLAIEDRFPNERPPLEKGGVMFSDRETIDKIEKMKVGTCLNPLHTILAVYGCLLGYNSISDEMNNKYLKAFVEKAGYVEGLPVVVDPGIINPNDFIKEVIEERFPNPFLKDTPQRIACDTSQKIPVRFGETLKAYVEAGKDVSSLTYIPLFFAGWIRYLMGVDDKGNSFTKSPDPMLDVYSKYVEDIELGDKGPFADKLKPILSDDKLFGVDLYKYNLAEKVVKIFTELVVGVGAIEDALKKYLDI
ncbi:mannitol dehydrogenase [Vallitalea longa]|uniref:Mannitol dehydrogenase n=1 Tax=Vallitalea longa TaxID=2936439 RepID=A0A9W5YEZ4_9FIRM|nr:mannitol dehydrogenase family protein [Vallitalea longa]GKX29983.1 mannitol dehydrogenase [Vallitalea longa]